MNCTREVLRAELSELRREHAATPARQTARRLSLARRIKAMELEITAFDASRAREIQEAR